MRLQVQSKAGIPNFSISTSPEDDVAALTSSAAEHAKLKPSDIRLSHAGRLLESRDRVEALGLADGDMLLMHVRSTGQQPAAHHSSTHHSSTHHSSDGSGFFVNVVTDGGRNLCRTKVYPEDDVSKLLDEASAKARTTSGVATSSGGTIELRFRKKLLQRGRTVKHYGLASGDELVMRTDEEDGSRSPSSDEEDEPRSGRRDSSSRRSAATNRDREANSQHNKRWGSLPNKPSAKAKTSTPTGGKARQGSRQDRLAGADDADIRLAADIMYDALSREVGGLRASNRRLRDELEGRFWDDSDDLGSEDDDIYGPGANRVRMGRARGTGGRANSSTGAIPKRTRDAFTAFEDESGFVSHKELKRALTKCGVKPQGVDATKALKPYDARPSGKLDLEAFDKLVREIEGDKSGKLTTTAIKDTSGKLTTTAIKAAPSKELPPRETASAAGVSPAKSSISATFEEFDRNDGGYLEYRGAVAHYGVNVNEQGASASRTPVGAQYDTWAGGKEARWTKERRAQEAAMLRNLDRDLKDEAIQEMLLTEQLVNDERDAAEREEELTQQLVDALEAEILDEQAAVDELFEAIELQDDPYDAVLGPRLGPHTGGGGFTGFGEPAYAHGYAMRYDDHNDYNEIEYEPVGRRRDGRDTERRGEKKKKSTAKKSVKGEKERGASDVFEDFDANDSGYLDYGQLRGALKHYGMEVSEQGAKEVLAAYDDTADGRLNLEEFSELVRDIASGKTGTKDMKKTKSTTKDVKKQGTSRDAPKAAPKGAKAAPKVAKVAPKGAKAAPKDDTAAPKESASAVFKRFDANDSGYLDYRELRNALDYYGVDVSTDVAKEVLEAYDDTPDGKLDQTEFAVLARDIESQSGNSKTSKPTQAKNSSARVPPRRPGQ